MRTSIVLSLDIREAKKDGTYPILLRITHFQKVSQITTGIYVKQKDWDEKARLIKGSYKGTRSVAWLNNYLQKKKSDAIDLITKLDEAKKLDTLTILELKKYLAGTSTVGSFFEYGTKLVKEMKEANSIGNARTYEFTLNVLKNYAGTKDLTFRDIDYAFLIKFEHDYLKKGNAVNGLAVYLRTIRSIFNRAIKSKVIEKELYPFGEYVIKTTKTRKRSISGEALKRIQGLELEPKHVLFHARNYFLSSFYLMGMSFTDLAHLKVGNRIDGRIQYDRQKTDKPYDIAITPGLELILSHYCTGKKKDDFIFPIITAEEPDRQYQQVLDARKRFNKKLKKLAELCGIEENLTSYVSRHSFATKAKNLGVPVAAISDMLGHSDTRTTQIYLDSLPSDMIDEIHRKILE